MRKRKTITSLMSMAFVSTFLWFRKALLFLGISALLGFASFYYVPTLAEANSRISRFGQKLKSMVDVLSDKVGYSDIIAKLQSEENSELEALYAESAPAQAPDGQVEDQVAGEFVPAASSMENLLALGESTALDLESFGELTQVASLTKTAFEGSNGQVYPHNSPGFSPSRAFPASPGYPGSPGWEAPGNPKVPGDTGYPSGEPVSVNPGYDAPLVVPSGLPENTPQIESYFSPNSREQVNATPEPSTIVLLGVALVGLFGFRKKLIRKRDIQA